MAGDEARERPGPDDAVLREAFRRFVLENEATLRQWMKEALAAMPELVDLEGLGREAGLVRVLERLVKAEVAASPVAARDSAPARALALFQTGEPGPPLPSPRVHASAGTGLLEVPESALGEPLQALLERDPYPLPSTADREGYHGERHFDYWLSGLEDFLCVRAALQRHGVSLAAPFSVLDFGCATGRVLRHFLCQVRGLDLWGTDLNESHVEWLLRHFPRSIQAFQCTTLPSLPLQEGCLDLVTAFSVFTHIDEYELGWLLELRRVLKARGTAYVTIHSDETWGRLRPGVTLYDSLFSVRDTILEHKLTPRLFEAPMPRDKTVFRWRMRELNNSQVFLSRRRVEEVWGRFFEVLEIVPQGSGYQDVVVLRKRG